MERRATAIGLVCLLIALGLAQLGLCTDALPFRAHPISSESEFTAAGALDVNADGRLDIVSGGWWYEAPAWTRHKLRDVERIGTRFDDYSNLEIDVDGDGDLDLVSVNYRSKSLYWVQNPGATAAKSDQAWERIVIDTPGPSETGRLVDVDGDGQLDVLPNGTTFAAWYSFTRDPSAEKGNQVRWTKHDLPKELIGHGIGSGDINGDGRIDLVNPNGWAEGPADPRKDRWLWHDEFQLPRDGSVPILIHDVDGDGDTDLVWGRGHNVGLYWTEQHRDKAGKALSDENSELLVRAHAEGKKTLLQLLGKSIWTTHAIDTSWSCVHAPLLADLDGDGTVEIIAGKRFQGHEGKDPGENEPLRVLSYQFDPKSRSWTSRIISNHPKCGLDLDPKCVDIDADGDLDIIGPARSGLVLLENLRIHSGPALPVAQWASYEPPLPESILHNDFSTMIVYENGKPQTVPIASALAVGDRRAQIQRQMELVMGPLPDSHQRTPLDVQVISIENQEKYTRIKLSYAPEPGDRVPAWLLIPHEPTMGRAGPDTNTRESNAGGGMDGREAWPGMLCLHPTQFELGKDQLLGLGGKPSRFYAHELAERGFVCLVPDYPGFGEYKYDFASQGKHYASGTMKAIWNNLRALDLLESLPCVEPDSIGCIGHSLGGHNALYTAAFDVRIRAVMSSCGFNAFEDYYGGNLKGWTSDRYMPRIASVYGSDPKRMPFDFPEVLAAIAPRPLLVNAPLHDANFAVVGVRKCETAVQAVYLRLNKPNELTVLYPDAEHDFPEAIRQQTYEWFEGKLGRVPAKK